VASISTDASGLRRILFTIDNKRRTIRLGRVPKKQAEQVCARIEALVAARITGTAVDNDTAAWVGSVSVDMARKLASAGLVGPRPDAATLGTFTRQYIDGRTDLKPRTILNLERARGRLVEMFNPSTPMKDITPADADRWRIKLAGHLAEATVARDVKYARQFFTAARRARLLTENPFEDVKAGSMRNPDRLRPIPPEWAAKLIEAAPDAQWRAIIALCRWGGLRCPSEVLSLAWGDVDWDKGRFLVRASKTEHEESGGLRHVPLFPELRPHLEALWDQAEPGVPHVITRYRSATQNLRTTFEKIILRAGLVPWPRPFQNLRATRETELAARFPLHVVVQWLGNSTLIAAKHYLSVTDADFALATGGAKSDARATQNPAQSATAAD
jgi:integrase